MEEGGEGEEGGGEDVEGGESEGGSRATDEHSDGHSGGVAREFCTVHTFTLTLAGCELFA